MCVTTIHFDVNGTIIATDIASQKETPDIIATSLANRTFASWSKGAPKTDYWRFVRDSNPHLNREERAKIVAQFPSFIENWRDPETGQYHRDREEIRNLNAVLIDAMKDRVFVPAFETLIERCQTEDRPIRIVLRTYGKDLPELLPLYQTTFRREIRHLGKFSGHTLQTQSALLETAQEVHDYFHSLTHDGAVEDDWSFWDKSGRKRDAGKLFPVGDKPTFFFDDHITEKESDIVHILDLNSGEALPSHSRAIRADLIEAIRDPDYYYNHVFGAKS